MYIVFYPALSENKHIPINDGTALLSFSASLSVADYHELERDGGRVQLWSDIPFEGPPAPNGEWTSCDFGFNAAASGSNLSSVQDFSLSLIDDDDLSSPGTVILTLQLLVPPFGNDQGRFSYTYRILYPNGEIRWLGEFGQNGTLVCEHTTTGAMLGLAAGWACKDGVYTWTDRIPRTDAPVLQLAKPDEYFAWTVGGKNGAFLTFLTARRNRRLGSVPPEYILCASPRIVMNVRPEKTISVTGDGSLVMSCLPHRQSDLSQFKSMILQHCSPERVAVTLAGKAREYMLITTRNTLPIEGITITTPNCSAPLSIPIDTLRSFFSSHTTCPLLVFAPQTFRAHLVTTDSSSITFANPGPFVLSPAFNIRSQVYISILSPHKSAELVDTAVGNLPTPPPSPEWVPRLITPCRLDSSSRSLEPASPTPAVQLTDGDDSGTQDDNKVHDEIVEISSTFSLRAVAMRTRYLFSVALFALRMVFKLVFGKSTAENEGADSKEHAAEHMTGPEELVTDMQAGVIDQKDNANDSVHGGGDDHEGRDIFGPLDDIPFGQGTSKIARKECPKVVWVEIDGSSTVRLAVCEGESNGVVGAEMNGKRVPVSRRNGTVAGTRVEFWELAVDVGGMLRISYDHDEVNVCV